MKLYRFKVKDRQLCFQPKQANYIGCDTTYTDLRLQGRTADVFKEKNQHVAGSSCYSRCSIAAPHFSAQPSILVTSITRTSCRILQYYQKTEKSNAEVAINSSGVDHNSLSERVPRQYVWFQLRIFEPIQVGSHTFTLMNFSDTFFMNQP